MYFYCFLTKVAFSSTGREWKITKFFSQYQFVSVAVAVAYIVESGAVVHLGEVREFVQDNVVDEPVGQIHEVVGEGYVPVAPARAESSCAPSDGYAVVAVPGLMGPIFKTLWKKFLGGFFQVSVYDAGQGLLYVGIVMVGCGR